MPDFLSIPGNIRQQYMPFTIAGPGKRQVFSFKDVKAKKYPQPCAQIHPFSKWVEALIQNDSSIQYTHGPDGSTKVTLSQFLDEIPSLQIREYVPDAKLTQTFKWFSYFKKGFDAGLQNIDNKAFTFEGMKTAIAEVMENIGKKMKELTSGDAPLLADVVGGLAHYYQDKGYNIGSDNGFAVLFLPFIMYYRLTTTHTNNVYEIPYSMRNEIMKSDGTYGWSGGNQSDFGLIDKAINGVGENSITKLLLGNTVKVNMMPSFQPTGEARGESFTINIDLINDSDEAAINNFLMCHTLFGNNRWLQYGFVQAGASLYDVKLPGANRYFMCTGAFSCKGKGAFRTPSTAVCEAIKNCAHPDRTFAGQLNKISLKDGQSLQDAMEASRAQNIVTAIGEEGASAAPAVQASSFNKRATTVPSAKLVGQYVQRGISAVKSKYDATVATMPSFKNVVTATTKIAKGETKAGFVTAVKAEQYKDTVSKVSDMSDKLVDAKNDLESKTKDLDNAYNELQRLKEEYDPDSPQVQEFEQNVYNPAYDAKQAADANVGKINDSLTEATTNMNNQRSALEATYKATAAAEITAYKEAATVTPEDIKKLIKIPDVYSLTLTFNSLLPDNFNNYLYGFRAGNLDPIENYARGTVDETGAFEKLVQQLENAMK